MLNLMTHVSPWWRPNLDHACRGRQAVRTRLTACQPPALGAPVTTDLTPEERRQLARLLDESAIRVVVAGYANSLGWMNWPVQESLSWEDARRLRRRLRGNRAAFLSFVKAREESYVRPRHMFGEPRIQLDGSDAQVASVAHVHALSGESRNDDTIYGRYLLGLQKRDGEWRLSSLYSMLSNVASTTSMGRDAGPLNSANNSCMTHPKAPRF